MSTARPALEIAQVGGVQLDVDVHAELRADEHLPPLGVDVAVERPIGPREMDRGQHLVADQRAPTTGERPLHDAHGPLQIAAAVHQRGAGQAGDVGGHVIARGLLRQVLLLRHQRATDDIGHAQRS